MKDLYYILYIRHFSKVILEGGGCLTKCTIKVKLLDGKCNIGDKIYHSMPISIEISVKGWVLGQIFRTNHINGQIGIKVTFLTSYIFILLDWVINFFARSSISA